MESTSYKKPQVLLAPNMFIICQPSGINGLKLRSQNLQQRGVGYLLCLVGFVWLKVDACSWAIAKLGWTKRNQCFSSTLICTVVHSFLFWKLILFFTFEPIHFTNVGQIPWTSLPAAAAVRIDLFRFHETTKKHGWYSLFAPMCNDISRMMFAGSSSSWGKLSSSAMSGYICQCIYRMNDGRERYPWQDTLGKLAQKFLRVDGV